MREQLGKKIRFEVFKRDRFTCQYCGRMAPDVILEVDHITPVCEGGTNDILNLVTACRDCNRGKGKTKLSVNEEVKKQQAQMLEMADKSEQLKMMIDWKKELLNIREEQAEYLSDLIEEITGYSLTEQGTRNIKKVLRQFPFELVCKATEISFNTYYLRKNRPTDYWDNKHWGNAFDKIGGICYNMTKEKADGDL